MTSQVHLDLDLEHWLLTLIKTKLLLLGRVCSQDKTPRPILSLRLLIQRG